MTIENELNGFNAISLVEKPAIEEDFLYLKKEGVDVKLATINKEQRIVMGPALIPDKPILRVDPETEEEYHIYFSKETVKKGAELYLMSGKQSAATLEHKEGVDDVCLVESWIVSDTEKDKSAAFGMPQKEGTWMVSLKINNDDIWDNYVKNGKVKGFSIEGMFSNKERADLSQTKSELQQVLELFGFNENA